MRAPRSTPRGRLARSTSVLVAASLLALGAMAPRPAAAEPSDAADPLAPRRAVEEPSAELAQAPAPARPRGPFDDLRLGRDDAGLGDGAWLAASVFSGSVRDDAITMGALDLGLRLALGEDARASLDWGIAFADTHVRGAYLGSNVPEPFDARLGRVEARNPDLRFEWTPRVSERVRVGVGLGAAIPVAATTTLPWDAPSESRFDASALVHEAYLASHGADRPWRFRPERAALYAPLSLALALSDDAVLAFDGAFAFGFRVLGGMGFEVLEDVQLGAELGGTLAPWLRLGARLNVTALALTTPSEAVQPSAEGWARLEFDPISVLARGTLGLGGPYGVGSDFVGWGVVLGASATFE